MIAHCLELLDKEIGQPGGEADVYGLSYNGCNRPDQRLFRSQ